MTPVLLRENLPRHHYRANTTSSQIIKEYKSIYHRFPHSCPFPVSVFDCRQSLFSIPKLQNLGCVRASSMFLQCAQGFHDSQPYVSQTSNLSMARAAPVSPDDTFLVVLTQASCCLCKPVLGSQTHLWMRKELPTAILSSCPALKYPCQIKEGRGHRCPPWKKFGTRWGIYPCRDTSVPSNLPRARQEQWSCLHLDL